MKDAAAISGSFADFKLIKTRSTAQIIIEIPIESADAALKALGGIPQPSKERPVAVARMTMTDDELLDGLNELCSTEPVKKRRDFEDLPLSQQAALLCEKPNFQTFLSQKTGWAVPDTETAADMVRQWCEVKSRSELDDNDRAYRAWISLRDDYQCHAA